MNTPTPPEASSKMARVQLVIPDEDRDRFLHQAQRERMTLSAWLWAAARARLEAGQQAEPFKAPADLEEFFHSCDALEETGPEPEWEEHLRVINESRRQGVSGT